MRHVLIQTAHAKILPINPGIHAKFSDISEVANYWKTNYNDLFSKSELFCNAFYNTTLPPEVIEAIAANLTILKSPTVLRQRDGKLWNWEGCGDNSGCCAGSCTHVWNYAQAIPHLFPALERTLRHTEFFESQDKEGHQTFRSALPIRPVATTFYAARRPAWRNNESIPRLAYKRRH